jgi:hypothetical protein
MPGLVEDAEALNRQALAIRLGYFGADHPETAATMTALAQSLAYLERYDEALALLRPSLEIRERVYGVPTTRGSRIRSPRSAPSPCCGAISKLPKRRFSAWWRYTGPRTTTTIT